MTKRQDLCLQRRSRSGQSDQRQPNQAANISHQPRALPNSTPLASRIEFPTMTGAVLSRHARLGHDLLHLMQHPVRLLPERRHQHLSGIITLTQGRPRGVTLSHGKSPYFLISRISPLADPRWRRFRSSQWEAGAGLPPITTGIRLICAFIASPLTMISTMTLYWLGGSLPSNSIWNVRSSRRRAVPVSTTRPSAFSTT